MTHKLVSVVVPSVPGSRFLGRTLESIIRQTYSEIEIIVVTDGTAKDPGNEKLIRELDDPRIRSMVNQRQSGANGARNTGIGQAAGMYIAMIDDDDLMKKEKLGKQVEYLEKNPDVGAVSTQSDVIDESGCPLRSIDDVFTAEDIFFHLIFNNCIVHSSMMFRKGVLEEAGLYDENLNQAQDYDLWSRLIRVTKIGQVNEKLVSWREHEQGITGKARHLQRLTSIHLAAENTAFFSGLRISPSKIAETQDRSESTPRELRDTLMLYRSVFRNVSSSRFLREKGITYHRSFLKKAMMRKAEMSMYQYFTRRNPVSAFIGFLFLPGYGKRIAAGKLREKLVR